MISVHPLPTPMGGVVASAILRHGDRPGYSVAHCGPDWQVIAWRWFAT